QPRKQRLGGGQEANSPARGSVSQGWDPDHREPGLWEAMSMAMIELRDDQLKILDAETQPVAAVDPRTGQIYRLIKQEVYNLVCSVVAPFNRGVEDDPAMDVYEQYRKKP